MKNYFIITYGCQMNVHESEKLAGILIEKGYTACDNKFDADLILLNTCCIRETAETHILGNLGAIKKIKETKPSLIVAVCGCMTQKEGTALKLKKRCPFINIIFGTHNIHKLGEYIDSLNNVKSITDIWDKEIEVQENVPTYRTSGLNAWVNIMYGCNNFCSYCIVPYVRGRERSRNMQNIIDDALKLKEEGYKQITLLGQNVNSYGNDFLDSNINFSKLLYNLSLKLDGVRISFMTSHPKDFSEEVVRTIADSRNISHFIHLPAQAGSDRILQLMNRNYTAKDYLHKIELIKKYIPNAGLSGDLMVGFPSETESDFLDTLKLVDEVNYNNLFTFVYSRRSGTKADLMENQIDPAIKKDRITRLIEKQSTIGFNCAKQCINKKYNVLCDSWESGVAKGRTDCNKIVTFNSKDNVYGQFLDVNIIKNKNSNLVGKICEV